MPKIPTPREVIAELTWAKLYAKRIQDDLNVLFKVLKEVQDISAGPQVLETAMLLREHLKLANSAIAALRTEAKVMPPAKKKVPAAKAKVRRAS
jgi:hypothetical protein